MRSTPRRSSCVCVVSVGTVSPSAQGAVKLHTLVDLRGSIPCFVHVSHGKMHDVTVLDHLPIDPDRFYVLDRGYVDFLGSASFHAVRGFLRDPWQTEPRLHPSHTATRRRARRPDCGQTGRLFWRAPTSSRLYPDPLRRITFYDTEHQRRLDVPDQQAHSAGVDRWATLYESVAGKSNCSSSGS